MLLKGVEEKSVQNSSYELDVMNNSHGNETASGNGVVQP
jgi:hypothetical protein